MSSESESEMYKFLRNFPPNSLEYRQPEIPTDPWVFWSEPEGCESNSSSADVGTPIIHDKIISLLSDIELVWEFDFLSQFWEPVTTIDGRRLLSTSAQPFALSELSNKLAKYRLNSEKYKYNIGDAHKLRTEPDHMIKTGGPATAFLNRRTTMSELPRLLSDSDDYGELNYSVMLPICFPSQTNCIGVLECNFHKSWINLAYYIDAIVEAIKKHGLDVFYVQDLIPYNTINGLKLAKDHIEAALKVVFLSSSLEDTQTKQLLAVKLTGCHYAMTNNRYEDFGPYFRFSDVAPRAIEKEFPLVTLQDNKSRYTSDIRLDIGTFAPGSALAICLSNDTGDYNYVFEFIWVKHSKCVNNIHLEALLLTLKRCLPSFKFTSGVEIGNELDVHIQGDDSGSEGGDESDIHNENDESKKFTIFQGKTSMVVNPIVNSKVTRKTTPKVIPREVIEKQFGKTMKDAAKYLNVSLSTLKRKLKELDIREWPGPNFVKRNKNGSSIIQSITNEEDNGAIEDTTVCVSKNMLTIKAKYEDDIIKFHLPVSQATFVHVEKEIGKKLELSEKTYKIKYLDEDGDWITLKSDEEMVDCINSSRKSNRIVVRMRVLSSRKPISGPNGS